MLEGRIEAAKEEAVVNGKCVSAPTLRLWGFLLENCVIPHKTPAPFTESS